MLGRPFPLDTLPHCDKVNLPTDKGELAFPPFPLAPPPLIGETMRPINKIIIHCSATPPNMDIGRDEIDRWHRERGWSEIGYHWVVRRNGKIERGRDESRVGAHAKGHNRESIGICMVGGVDKNNKAESNFTRDQWDKAEWLVWDVLGRYGNAEVIGHREVSDKECPSFDVKAWWRGT